MGAKIFIDRKKMPILQNKSLGYNKKTFLGHLTLFNKTHWF